MIRQITDHEMELQATIERLERDLTAADIRIENDKLELTEMTAERDEAHGLLAEAIDRIIGMNDELAALKNQQPVAWQYVERGSTWLTLEKNEAIREADSKDEITPLFLAPGAQPVKEGWVMVPEFISTEMYDAYHKVDDAAWCAGSSNGANMSEIWDAMLAAVPKEVV